MSVQISKLAVFLSHYLNPGPGFGGPYLAKDLKFLICFAGKANAGLPLLKAVLERNGLQIKNIIDYVMSELKDIGSKKIAVPLLQRLSFPGHSLN
ncbi:hypothetical protein [Desulfosporosinus sp. BICA1-9]|uniref:hypothetical protein n=1 Tax=Desulfosporosinus sp. BICA1-9 TaxID=1531958 RepID=UPI000E89AE18|nr:hypothetical protein [Desulfosporosinus sp.]